MAEEISADRMKHKAKRKVKFDKRKWDFKCVSEGVLIRSLMSTNM